MAKRSEEVTLNKKVAMNIRSHFCCATIILGLSPAHLFAADWPQWRGPDRDGTSRETGLLQEWPSDGPKLLWTADNLGRGYSTPSVAGDRIYLLANEGVQNEYVQALDSRTGDRLWVARLGNVGNPDQQPPFFGARSTPTVDGDHLYALGSDGDLACLDAATGRIRWQRNLRSEFGGRPGTWAYAESPLIDGNRLICTPGGADATIIALDKQSGEVIWRSPMPEADDAAYASPIVVEVDGVRQYVQLLQKGLVGVEARSGRLLWRYSRPTSAFNANIPSPVTGNGLLYCGSAGTGGGAIRLKLNQGTIQVEELYFGSRYPTAIGGVVRVGDHLYGTTAQAMLCFDFASGEVKWQERAIGAAAICHVDGRLYLRGENGEVALVVPDPAGYVEKGRFTPPNMPERAGPMERAWAYPVVANGRLYLREHDLLWCYDVKATQ
jgi:outer membrane protein assembly factor BamB